MKGGKIYYIAIFPGEKLLYSHFPGGKMTRGKGYYTTPVKGCKLWAYDLRLGPLSSARSL
jgi:hypothetical protein